jgi:hypothetical protein
MTVYIGHDETGNQDCAISANEIDWNPAGYVCGSVGFTYSLDSLMAYAKGTAGSVIVAVYSGTTKVASGNAAVAVGAGYAWLTHASITWYNGYTALTGGATYILGVWSSNNAVRVYGTGGASGASKFQGTLSPPDPLGAGSNFTYAGLAVRGVITGTLSITPAASAGLGTTAVGSIDPLIVYPAASIGIGYTTLDRVYANVTVFPAAAAGLGHTQIYAVFVCSLLMNPRTDLLTPAALATFFINYIIGYGATLVGTPVYNAGRNPACAPGADIVGQCAHFKGGVNVIGIDSGVVFTSGDASQLPLIDAVTLYEEDTTQARRVAEVFGYQGIGTDAWNTNLLEYDPLGAPTDLTAHLQGDISSDVRVIRVDEDLLADGWPFTGVVVIGSERIYYSGRRQIYVGGVISYSEFYECFRGFDSTTAAAHLDGVEATMSLPANSGLLGGDTDLEALTGKITFGGVLAADITALSNSLTIRINGVGIPATNGIITIDSEDIFYTAYGAGNFTGLSRHVNGTSAAPHTEGALVKSISTGVQTTYNANTLEFSFSNAVAFDFSFKYVFASEEYMDFVFSSFNDVCAVWIDGVNVAVLPDDYLICINNINPLVNPTLYRNNIAGYDTDTNYIADAPDFNNPTYPSLKLPIIADGLTTVLSSKLVHLAAGTHTVKIAVADASDANLDCALFIESYAFANPNGEPPIQDAVGSGSAGDAKTLVYPASRDGWFVDVYDPSIVCHEGEEGDGVHSILCGGSDGILYQLAGTDDDGTPIPCHVRTPSEDQGDPRAHKLYGDIMLDVEPNSVAITATPGYDGYSVLGAAVAVTGTSRVQTPVDPGVGGWNTHKNIALDLDWVGSGPLFYIWEPRWAKEPGPISALTCETPECTHDLKGYLYLGDCYIAHNSTANLSLVITVDGVAQPALTIAHSAGADAKTYLRLPVMKGKSFKYRISSTAVFRLRGEQCEFKIKQWGSDSPYLTIYPFREIQLGAAA